MRELLNLRQISVYDFIWSIIDPWRRQYNFSFFINILKPGLKGKLELRGFVH